MRSRKTHQFWLLTLFADISAVVLSYYSVLFARAYVGWVEKGFTFVNEFLDVRDGGFMPPELVAFYLDNAPRILLILVLSICFFYAMMDLYSGRRHLFPRALGWTIAMANGAALGSYYIYFYLSRNVFHPRGFFVLVIALNIILAVSFRAVIQSFCSRMWRKGIQRVPVLLVGSGKEAEFLRDFITARCPHGLIVAAYLSVRGGDSRGFLNELSEELGRTRAEMMILAEKDMPVSQIMEVLELAEDKGVDAKVLSREMAVLVGKAGIVADIVQGAPLVSFPVAPGDPSVMMQWISRLTACFLIVLLMPVFAVLAILIRATSRGPVFFVQERIGVNRKSFPMFKFRTMFDRADALQAELDELNEVGKGMFKIRKDPRITPVGRFLRRFSLDELPQLLNVVRGDMVFVGPRPLPRRDFENYYEKWHYSRHEGQPGLTCLWQVSGRNELDFPTMCLLDVYYLRNRSWILDTKILLRTLVVVFTAKGAF